MNGAFRHRDTATTTDIENESDARPIDLVKSLSPEQLSVLRSLEQKTPPPESAAGKMPGPAKVEKRQTPRRRVFLGAKIIFNGRTIVIDCHVRDISDCGCRIRTQSTAGIPQRFTLLFTAANRCRECESRWRDDSHIGIRFLS